MFYAEQAIDSYVGNKYFGDYSYLGCMVEVGAGPSTKISCSKHFSGQVWI